MGITILYKKHISKLESILIIGAPAAFPTTMKLSILPTPKPRPKAIIAKGMVKSRNIYTHWLRYFHSIRMLSNWSYISNLTASAKCKDLRPSKCSKSRNRGRYCSKRWAKKICKMTCGLCHPATVGVVKIIKGRLNLTLESEVNGFISKDL